MHRYFPFDSVTIKDQAIAENEIVAAAMRFVSGGNDTAVTTADGKTHFFRRSVRREAVFEVFGDRSGLCELKPVAVTLYRQGEKFLTFPKALVSAEFNAERNSTLVRVYEVSFP